MSHANTLVKWCGKSDLRSQVCAYWLFNKSFERYTLNRTL